MNRAYFYAVGRRKTARATVRVFFDSPSGDFSVNDKNLLQWADARDILLTALRPLDILSMRKDVDVVVISSGGGKKAQADALSLGLARALIKKDPSFRSQLKDAGLLTRDPRSKERKKPGLKRARRSPQWSKR